MSAHSKPTGHLALPLITFSFLSLILGIAVELIGVFEPMTIALHEWFTTKGVVLKANMGLPGLVGILITALASFGLTAAILGTPGNGRRAIIGITTFMLCLFLVPAFSVWGIFWKPFGVLLAVGWSWFSSSIYAYTHLMPCEIVVAPAVNIINFEDESQTPHRTKSN